MDDRAHQVARMAQELAAARSDSAAAVIDGALSDIADADAVSITLRERRGRYVTLEASGDLPRRLDKLQHALREGPCVSIADGDDWLRSGDIGRDTRWPSWGPYAQELGINSLLSVALLVDGTPNGALNIYARAEGAFGERADVDSAGLYATHAAIALTTTRQVVGLESALHSRHLIGIAQGILVERYGLDVERSFQLLRRLASTSSTTLATVAEEIVRNAAPGQPPPDEPEGRPQPSD